MHKAAATIHVLLTFAISPLLLMAQDLDHYNPRRAFDPAFPGAAETAYRSAGGTPGPGYWQNRADYVISATLDTLNNTLSAHEVITYSNASPDELPFVWLQLDQNIMKKDSRGNLSQPGRRDLAPETTEGFNLNSVTIVQGSTRVAAKFIVTDTRMQIILPTPLQPGGGQVAIEIDYSFKIPHQGAGRMGRVLTSRGSIYDIAQWYPRMAVYDDERGWDNLPYLGSGEFYLEYGDFDYTLDVPSNQIVVGSGELLNAEKVLSPAQQQKLREARSSDKTVTVRSVADVASEAARAISGERKIWHFTMKNTRDVAWAASSAFVWDAVRVHLPSGKPCLAMSVYPTESAGDSAYGRAAEYAKNSIEIFSKDLFEYPWEVATTVGGPVGGQEYPGIVFCSSRARGKELWWVTSHEIGHNWFPMIVGTNERRYAFLDEGFNTYADIAASEKFNHGEFAPKRDAEYAPGGGNPASEIVLLLLDRAAPPMITTADATPEQYRHPLAYFKSAFGLVLLRTDILGPDRFDFAFREYIKAWAFKHPGPHDFFRAINNASGENLNWFWKGWFMNSWTVDQQIENVKYPDNDPGKGALVTIRNTGELPMPVTIAIYESNHHAGRVQLPVEVWQQSGEWTFHFPSTSPIDSVVVDPDHHLPDVNRANNVWTSIVKTTPTFRRR